MVQSESKNPALGSGHRSPHAPPCCSTSSARSSPAGAACSRPTTGERPWYEQVQAWTGQDLRICLSCQEWL